MVCDFVHTSLHRRTYLSHYQKASLSLPFPTTYLQNGDRNASFPSLKIKVMVNEAYKCMLLGISAVIHTFHIINVLNYNYSTDADDGQTPKVKTMNLSCIKHRMKIDESGAVKQFHPILSIKQLSFFKYKSSS